jgi:hypothetical protein
LESLVVGTALNSLKQSNASLLMITDLNPAFIIPLDISTLVEDEQSDGSAMLHVQIDER